jgi:hypothetical protein
LKAILIHSVAAFLLSVSALAQMQSFSLQEVKVTGGAFKNAQDVDLRYILSLNPDKLLAPYLIDAGLPLKAERYGNWESSGLGRAHRRALPVGTGDDVRLDGQR